MQKTLKNSLTGVFPSAETPDGRGEAKILANPKEIKKGFLDIITAIDLTSSKSDIIGVAVKLAQAKTFDGNTEEEKRLITLGDLFAEYPGKMQNIFTIVSELVERAEKSYNKSLNKDNLKKPGSSNMAKLRDILIKTKSYSSGNAVILDSNTKS